MTNVRYVNQNAASVTVVSHEAFVGARPVRISQMAVPADAIVQARVVGTTAFIAPERSSVMGRPQGTIAAPPSRFAERAVVVRTAPPPPPVSFAARRDALQANPGHPLDTGTAEALRRAPPVAPMAARDAVAPRSDRPRQLEQQAAPRPQAQTTVQSRTEPRSEGNQERKTERKQEKKKGEARKEDGKEDTGTPGVLVGPRGHDQGLQGHCRRRS